MAEPIRAALDTPISSIQIGSRIRPVSEATVSALDHVITEYGFTVPILLRKARSGLWLIDGANRLETMRRRGAEIIPAVHMECTDNEAAAMESSQNIAGAGMSPLDDALFLAAYADAYEKLHPETRRGAASAHSRQGAQKEFSSFREIIAEKRAISERQVNKIVAAGRQIHRDEADLLRRAPKKITIQDLQDIGKIGEPDQRAEVIRRLAEGSAKSAAEARRTIKGAGPIIKDPVNDEYKALLNAWSRARAEARRRFVEDVFADLSPMVVARAEHNDAADVAQIAAFRARRGGDQA